ncbi:anti-sigma factor [Paenibacillus sp. RUD330]|uniref:anti-sigma factor family protein n=2 Tax=Paenibacillus TaxID=44249 RepID=UPI0012FE5EEC|nr:anti-sigma factor [Paenibacillus sp. RUD330]ASS66052.2 zf-HC2 domain-containing protein [Paenibacillus sp. RUD330]
MNRYLDGDLDEHERVLLMEHLKNCPDDQELFERLQRLSEELEELPKVTPPFSLVDSILPQLAEIDALRDAKAAQAAVMDEERTQAEEAAAAEGGSLGSHRASRKRTGWLGRRTAAWGGATAVAAAAIILAVSLNGPHPNRQTAMLESKAPAAAGNASPYSSAADQEAADTGGAAMKSMEEGTGSSEPATSPTAVSDGSRGTGGGSGTKPSTPPSPSARVGGVGGASQFNKSDPNNSGSANLGGPSMGIAQFPSPPASPSPGTEQGFASQGLAASAASPDGKYSYTVTGNLLEVFESGDKKLAELKLDGELQGSPSWSSDSTTLAVEVKDGSGAVKKFKIAAAEGTVEEQKS